MPLWLFHMFRHADFDKLGERRCGMERNDHHQANGDNGRHPAPDIDRERQRKRNTALVLIFAGLYIILGKVIGFYAMSALFIVVLGIYKVRSGSGEKWGYILLAIGTFILVSNFLSILIAIVMISIGFFFMKSKQVHRDDSYLRRQHLLLSLKWDKQPWELRNTSIWSAVSEIVLDFSMALPEEKETTLVMQGVLADVDIVVPEDFGVAIEATAVFGQVDALSEKQTGMMNKLVWKTPNYDTSEHKVKLLLAFIVADIDIRVV